MNAPDPHDWHPDPQLLGAYFDGEMEGRDDAVKLRAHLETWLEQHPDARTQWAEHQALLRLWQDTTPREPTAVAWRRMLERIDAERRRPAQPAVRRVWRPVGVIAAGIAVFAGLTYGVLHFALAPDLKMDAIVMTPRDPTPKDDVEVFQVATADEVVVSYIEGADIRALAVGRLPVQEPIELAEIGEVRFIAVRSDAPPRMRPQVRQDGPSRPMIWVPLDAD